VSESANNYKDKLASHLLKVATGGGFLKGTLLSCPDIDDAWTQYAQSFCGDAVREFNAYPEYCLACAGYLGMAVAHFWDEDWPRYSGCPYSFFQGSRGFDDMDDYITGHILKEKTQSVAAMESCSAECYHFLLKAGPEPGTADAYRLFLQSVEVMFKLGAAIELCRLGYRIEQVG